MDKIRSLFLAANPLSTERISLDKEIREITSKIRWADYGELIDVISIWAVRPEDLLQSLNTYRPQIVHFSGHGSEDGQIILVDNGGNPKPVSASALKSLFTTLKDNIRLVILNACYSKVQAEAIIQVIDCAIGMTNEIEDSAATTFVSTFYSAIGFRRSVQDAFDQAKVALMLDGQAQEHVPVLLTRQGVDPSQMVLVGPAPVKTIIIGTDQQSQQSSGLSPVRSAKNDEIRVNVVAANVMEFKADVLALKYAMYLYGADSQVARALKKSDDDIYQLVPVLGQTKLLYTQGVIVLGLLTNNST